MTKTKMCSLVKLNNLIYNFTKIIPSLQEQYLHFHYDIFTHTISLLEMNGRKPMEGDDMCIRISEEGDLYEITVTGDKSFCNTVGDVLNHIENWFA